MKIQVLGSGCASCKNLFELSKKAVVELGIEAEVEYSTDVTKIIELGVMQSPVLVIDSKVAMLGAGNLEKVKEVIKSNQGCCTDKDCCDIKCKPNKENKGACSCGGCC